MRFKQTELEIKISNEIENLIIEQIKENPKSIHTYLSNDLATIYIKDKFYSVNNKSNNSNILEQQFEVFKSKIKNRLKSLLHHDVLEVFPMIDPKGMMVFIVVFCNPN
jgi:hypothetical protein